jgi:1,2-diacylglycerol 3-alpha-glucosyltransferase
MLTDYTVAILTNIIAPYKTLLFNELTKLCKNTIILYVTRTSDERQWDIKEDRLRFPYEIIFPCSLNKVNPLMCFTKTWGKLNALKPDILIVDGYSYSACWAGLLWAKLNCKKLILWSSSNLDDHKRIFVKEFIKSIFVKKCDAANSYGTKSKQYLLTLGAGRENRILPVGNCTDNDFYFNQTAKFKTVKTTLCRQMGVPTQNFLYIGRFSPEKNVLHIVKSYEKLQADKWGLILVGSGPQTQEIKAYIENRSIKNIFMPGFQQKEQLPKYLAVSNIFILASISETWGLSVNEAMAAGLPVLVSHKCGCYPDIVKDGVNGFIFDPYDEFALSNLMNNIIQGKFELEDMGEKSLEIIKDFTPGRAAEIISNTIALVIQKERLRV